MGEIEDLLAAFNAAVKSHADAQRFPAALQIATATEGALALWVPPVAATTGPTAAFGEAKIQRRWEQTIVPEVNAVSLLAQHNVPWPIDLQRPGGGSQPG